MIRKEVEKLRGLVLTPEELEGVILPLVATSKERNKEEKVKVYLPKELANKSKEVQETLDKFIEAGLIPPDITLDNIEPYEPTKHVMKPVYVTSNVWSCISSLIESKDFMGLAMTLSSLVYVVDDETMEQIQQVVEKRKK